MSTHAITSLRLTLQFFFRYMSARTPWSGNIGKNRIQNPFSPKQTGAKIKSNNFGNLIGQNIHVPLCSTTFVHFDFVPRKNQSCVWRRSRDMNILIYSTLSIAHSLILIPHSKRHLALDNLTVLVISRNRTASDTEPKMEASKNPFIFIMKSVYSSHSKILNFKWTSKSPSKTRLVNSQTNASLASYFLVFQRSYIQTCSNNTHLLLHYIYNRNTHTRARSRIKNKQYSDIFSTFVLFVLVFRL